MVPVLQWSRTTSGVVKLCHATINNSIINPHTHIAHSIKVAFSFRFASLDNTNTPLLYVGYYNNKHISKHFWN